MNDMRILNTPSKAISPPIKENQEIDTVAIAVGISVPLGVLLVAGVTTLIVVITLIVVKKTKTAKHHLATSNQIEMTGNV